MGMPNVRWKAHGKKLSVGTYDDALPGEQWPFAIVRKSETVRDKWVAYLNWLHPDWASDAVDYDMVPVLPRCVEINPLNYTNSRAGARARAIELFEKIRDNISEWNRARRAEGVPCDAGNACPKCGEPRLAGNAPLLCRCDTHAEKEETIETVRAQRNALAAMLIDIVGPDVVAQYLKDKEGEHGTSAN